MYILNKEEKGILKTIVVNARIDYFRSHKYIFREETIENKVIYSNENFEEEVEYKEDSKIQANKLENIFTEKNMMRIAKTLTYNEKLVLSLYYIEGKTDEQISEILFLTRSAITKKRKNALEKLRKKYKNGGIKNV